MTVDEGLGDTLEQAFSQPAAEESFLAGVA